LSLSLLSGALVLALWMGLDPLQWALIAVRAAAQPQTVSLLLVVGLILIMSRLMKEAGQMDRLVKSFSRFTRDTRKVGSVIAALIGLLPMPGGALFSAPLVEASLSDHELTGEQKTVVNYWFRHIWEYWWPLYPGVVLAVALLEVDTWQFMVTMMPMTLLSVLAGAVFILQPIRNERVPEKRRVSFKAVREFVLEIMPILIVILVIIFLGGVTAVMNRLGFHLKIPGSVSILPGLLASLCWVCRTNRIPFGRIKNAVLDKGLLPLLLLLLTIMIFKSTLIESRAVLQIRDELIAYRIPLTLVVMFIPFISGLVTGVAVGFVGTSFPLVISMFPSHSLFEYLSYAALAYTFGYMGMMLSPVHLCFLVTKDYYRADMMKSYRRLILPVLSVLSVVTLLFFLTRLLLH